MNQFCNTCPTKCIVKNFEKNEQALAVNVAQGLSGAFVKAVRGTKGLTDERIEEIRQKEIESWNGSAEAQVLETNPELAHAVYECEEKVTILGNCALHSII